VDSTGHSIFPLSSLKCIHSHQTSDFAQMPRPKA